MQLLEHSSKCTCTPVNTVIIIHLLQLLEPSLFLT